MENRENRPEESESSNQEGVVLQGGGARSLTRSSAVHGRERMDDVQTKRDPGKKCKVFRLCAR